MNRKNKRKIGIVLIGIVLIIVLMLLTQSFLGLNIIPQTIEYNGFTFTDNGPTPSDSKGGCNEGNVGSSVSKQDKFLVLEATGSKAGISRTIEADVFDADEVLVAYDGYVSAYCSQYTSASGSVSASLVGEDGQGVGSSKSFGVSCRSTGLSQSQTFEPSLFQFKNNFDGTWSSGRQVGSISDDLFMVDNTAPINGKPKLRLSISAGGGCGSQSESYGANAKLKVINIAIGKSSFAVCKIDQFIQDVNQDGKIATDGSECFDLPGIKLENKEALQESINEKFARLEEELLSQNQQLKDELTSLKTQIEQESSQQKIIELNSQIDDLKAKQEETSSNLAGVQAKDKNVIATIESQESFEEIGKTKTFINRFIAWVKSLFY